MGDAAEGLRYLWRNRVIRVVALGFCAIVVANGVDDVALVFLAKDVLHQGDSAASALEKSPRSCASKADSASAPNPPPALISQSRRDCGTS